MAASASSASTAREATYLVRVARLPVGGGLVGDGALLFQGPQHGAHAASAGFFQLLQLRLAAGGLKRGDGRKGAGVRRPLWGSPEGSGSVKRQISRRRNQRPAGSSVRAASNSVQK